MWAMVVAPPGRAQVFLSVLEWRWSEQAGHGDLRFYGAIQVYAVLVLLLMLFLPGRYTRTADPGVVVGLYVLAKLFEIFDKSIFALGRVVSGHTLKHIAAGLAGYWIVRMLQRREQVTKRDEIADQFA